MKSFILTKKCHSGFTLVELLVYFGLFAILLVVINGLFITSLEQQSVDSARSALQQESEYVLAKLKYDIYNADAVILPANGGDQSQSLELSTDGTTSTYALNAGRLTKASGGATWFITSSQVEIQALQFENQSGSSENQTIGLNITINSNQAGERTSATREISTSVTLR